MAEAIAFLFVLLLLVAWFAFDVHKPPTLADFAPSSYGGRIPTIPPRSPRSPRPPAPVGQGARLYRCDYCRRYGPLGSCAGCGATLSAGEPLPRPSFQPNRVVRG